MTAIKNLDSIQGGDLITLDD